MRPMMLVESAPVIRHELFGEPFWLQNCISLHGTNKGQRQHELDDNAGWHSILSLMSGQPQDWAAAADLIALQWL